MATTSKRSIVINFVGDFDADNSFAASNNITSPAQSEFITLANGENDITPPEDATALTLIFPAGNQTEVTLKGDPTDVGIVLHKTDPTSIAINDPTALLYLFAAAEIEGVRLVWS